MHKKTRGARSGGSKKLTKPATQSLRQYAAQKVRELPKLPDPKLGGINLPYPPAWKGTSSDWDELEQLGGSPYSDSRFQLPAAICHRLAGEVK